MIRVVSASATPEHVRRVREWFVAEWGPKGAFDLDGVPDPGPLVAIADGEPVGGLAFTRFQRPGPGPKVSGLWINALFVPPKHRRKGIASHLIQAAEAEAVRLREGEVYALTDIPALYEKLGWHLIRSDAAGTVVGKTLTK